MFALCSSHQKKNLLLIINPIESLTLVPSFPLIFVENGTLFNLDILNGVAKRNPQSHQTYQPHKVKVNRLPLN